MINKYTTPLFLNIDNKAQVVGTSNDASARTSYDAGAAAADDLRASQDTVGVRTPAMVKVIYHQANDSDKHKVLWPNLQGVTDYQYPKGGSFDYNNKFYSPTYLE